MTTTGSGSGDFFEYKGVQTCQVNIDKKFKELAECLKGANDYMNAHIDTAADETAIKGELGKRFLDDWNMNASTFGDFYENFSSWSLLMASIIEQYGTFELEAVKNAIKENQSTGATLKGVAETREAQAVNEELWKSEQTQQEMISESLNPTYMAKLGWEKSVISNAAYYDNSKVNQTISDIANGVVVYDTDGNAVNGLKLCPDKMDEENYNEYMIYEGVDVNGNKQYYSIDENGKLRLKDKDSVKDVGTVAQHMKVGDTFDNGQDLNGDNAIERISKASYIVGYDANSNQTYMALPHSDGTVEYYAVKGQITTDSTDNMSNSVTTGEITNVNVTAEQIQAAGFKPLYTTTDYGSQKQDVAAIQQQYGTVGGVEATNTPTDNGYYSNGQFYGTPGGAPVEEEKDGTTPQNYGSVPPGSVPKDDDDENREILI